MKIRLEEGEMKAAIKSYLESRGFAGVGDITIQDDDGYEYEIHADCEIAGAKLPPPSDGPYR